MAKSFCSGCKYWLYSPADYISEGFHYCDRFNISTLLERKLRCNGEYKGK